MPEGRREERLSLMSDILAQDAMVGTGQQEQTARAIAGEVAALAGDTAAERELLAVYTMYRVWRGECTASEALAIADRALGEGAFVTEGRPDSVALGVVLHALIVAEGFATAEREIDRGIEHAQQAGSFFGYAMCTVMRNISALRRGFVGRGDTDPNQIVENALALESPIGIGVAGPTAVDILRERGELDRAQELLERAGLAGELPPVGWIATALESRGRLRLAAGDPTGALRDLLEAGERVADWRATNPAVVPWRSSAALAHLALGDRDAAATLADEEVAASEAFGAPRAHGIALRARALCADGDEQISRLGTAVDVLARSEARLEQARAIVDLGAALRRANRRAEAREQLRAGLDLARRCEAQALTDQAVVELRATGARLRRTAVTGADALTASERRVAGMAAAGASNREIAQALFVSTRTVETHLQRAYKKLRINSRTELDAALGSARR
jgi:ATP/maltotriose-dependent transcriptional regulator MalT